MSGNSIFWKIHRGELPPPKIAITLQAETTVINPEAKSLEVTFVVGERFTNPVGNVQGGILTAMLDAVMGPCNGMVLTNNQFAPTLNINVSFIKPAKPGQFTGKANVTHQGLSVCFLYGELFDEQATLIATATATAKVVTLND